MCDWKLRRYFALPFVVTRDQSQRLHTTADFPEADFRGVRGCTSKSSPLQGHVDTHETQTFAVRQP